MQWDWSEDEKENLVKKIMDLTRYQATALMIWAMCFWNQEDMDIEQYIKEKVA